MVVVEVVGLFRQGPRGVAALPVRVDGPVVVRTGPILAAAVSGPTEEQPGFVPVLSAIAAAAAGRYGVPAAGVATPLLPTTSGQENDNECDNQEQGQKGADDGARHDAGAGRILQGFCRGDEGVGRRGGKMGGGKEKKRAGIDGCFLRKCRSALEEVFTVLLVL